MKSMHWVWIGALALTAGWAGAQEAAPAGEQKVALNIPAQPVGDALNEFGRQTGLDVVLFSRLGRGVTAEKVEGEYTPGEALERILASAGLHAEYIDAKTVAVLASRPSKQTSPIRLAGNDTGTNTDPTPSAVSEAAVEGEKRKPTEALNSQKSSIEEVVVTGSHIRGENPTSPLLSIDRQQIKDSGYSSTEQLIESLPQNFSGGTNGASETGIFGPNSGASFNISNATGINLRGLGTTSTLVLIDGHKIASAIQGTAVDVSLIPLSAISRVDIVPEGASAIYGSDAIAGVVNFVLRKDFEGAETMVHFGEAEGSVAREVVASQAIGHDWGTGNLLMTIQYQHRDPLETTDRDFTATAAQPTYLLPKAEAKSIFLNAHQLITPSVDLYTEDLFTRKNSDRSLTNGTIGSLANEDATDGTFFVGGARVSLPQDWEIDASGSFSKESDQLRAYYNVGAPRGYTNGALLNDNDYTTKSLELRADGRLFALPGGDAKLALGGTLESQEAAFSVPYRNTLQAFSRHVSSEYAETLIPIVGERNAIEFAQRIDLSASIRTDDYSDFGRTTNPRVGLNWQPAKALKVHAAYSRSFRAPTPFEEFPIASGQIIYTYPFAQPQGGTAPIFVLTGSKPDLQPERARNLSFGVDVAPVDNLDVSVDYYDIDFRNRIVRPPTDVSALLHPAVYGPLITSFATSADAQAFLQSVVADDVTFMDFLHTGTANVRYAFDARAQNAARVRQKGVDVLGRYRMQFGLNAFETSLNLAFINNILTSYTEAAEPSETVDTYGNPLKWRGRAGLTWTRGPFRTALWANYSGGYADTTVSPVGRVASWTTFDITSTFSPGWIRGLAVTVSAQNIADRDPPRTGTFGWPGIFYDAVNANPLGRLISIEVTKKW